MESQKKQHSLYRSIPMAAQKHLLTLSLPIHILFFVIALAAQLAFGVALLFRERGEDERFTGDKLIYRS